MSLESSIVIFVIVVPTVIDTTPCVRAPDVEAKPDDRTFDSRARLLTSSEKVPDVARLEVVKVATLFVSVALLFENSPEVERKRDSVFRVLTILLKFLRRSLRSLKLSNLASSRDRFASTRAIGWRWRVIRLSMIPLVSKLELIPNIAFSANFLPFG